MKQFKDRKTLYGNLSPKNITELKVWGLMHVDLIGSYSKSIRQNITGVTIINNNVSLTCRTMINPATGWFKVVKIPTYELD